MQGQVSHQRDDGRGQDQKLEGKKMKKEHVIFKGKAKPGISWGGTSFYPKKREDKFGILKKGEYRIIRVDTQIGQLFLSKKFGNKNIEIVIRET